MHKIYTSHTFLVFLGGFFVASNENPRSLFPRSNYYTRSLWFRVKQDVGSAASMKIVDVFEFLFKYHALHIMSHYSAEGT